ncbi:hypothetical protein PJF56_11675 [Roseofilum sp. BLCC_M91]|uniref:Uncharacterized protein n=1 Tax=Roseofilum halophilum BLCC-M91 TaxID=3022259 RepID=A0ABT7BK00_9CYAN|nr:hypothetical protein [Roseofilum halophilum]MDJ1179523.1 hypothetical protein [Roseofilum halophilum BLCC-M91]
MARFTLTRFSCVQRLKHQAESSAVDSEAIAKRCVLEHEKVSPADTKSRRSC